MRWERSLLVPIGEYGTVGMQWDSKFGRWQVPGRRWDGVIDLVEGSLNIQMTPQHSLLIKFDLPSA